MSRRATIAVLFLPLLARGLPARAGGVVVKTIGYQLLEGDKFPAFYAHLLGADFNKAWTQYQQANSANAQEMFLDAGVHPQANDFASVTLQNQGDADANGVRVEVGVEGFAEPAVQTVNIPAGQTATVALTPAFTDKIYGVQELTPVNIDVKVTDGQGKAVFEKTKRMTLLSKDYMVWGIDSDYDLAFGIASFVTPHDSLKAIDRLLSAAAEKAPGRALGGYQGDDSTQFSRQKAVEDQARAIYDTIHEMGIKYVNAPISYGRNDQRVKFPSASVADKSGNCIEGTLLFASAFESLGMRPVVILVPGHAFVGVRLWDNDDTILPIETTMVGTDPYKAAVTTAITELNQYLSQGQATIVDIAVLRQLGIMPAPM
jgi:hypothetical protein